MQARAGFIPELLVVGDPGNKPDTSGYGAVSELFYLSKCPVTVDQWALFMNAVYVSPNNPNDPRHLYHEVMVDDKNPFSSLELSVVEHNNDWSDKGVYSARSLKSNFFPASVVTNGSFPITNITIEDAKRYCNWCEHGCPQTTSLEEALTVTESGAYDFTNGREGEPINGASYALPSADQLYKAMYYKAGTHKDQYWLYPTKSDTLSLDSLFDFFGQKRKGANIALKKYDWSWKAYRAYYTGEEPYLTPVGFFDGSPGPYGHEDLGGNVRTWTSDAVVTQEGMAYLALGGSWEEEGGVLKSSEASRAMFLSDCYSTIGMRLVMNVPQQSLPTPIFNAKSDLSSPIQAPQLFFDALGNVAFAQLSAYLIEAILNAIVLVNPEFLAGEITCTQILPWIWSNMGKICAPFTLPRNLVNVVLSLLNAAGMSTEAAVSMKDDSWGTIALLSTESIATMLLVEGSGALVEKPVEWLLNTFRINTGSNKAEEGWTVVRLLLNVYYVGINSYLNVHSAIQEYQKQHPRS